MLNRIRRASYWKRQGHTAADARELAQTAKDHPDWTADEVHVWYSYQNWLAEHEKRPAPQPEGRDAGRQF